MSTILVCAVPTPGHVLPMRLIARHLREQGHTVRFLTGALFADMLQADGIGFEPLCPQGDCDYRDPTFEVPASGAGEAVAVNYNALQPGDAQMTLALTHFFAPAVPFIHQQLQALIAEHDVDVVAFDSMFTGVLPLLQQTARPAALMIGLTPFALSTGDSLLFGPRIPPQVLPPALHGRCLRSTEERAMLRQVGDAFSAATVRAGGQPLSRLFADEMILNSDACLQLATTAFEYPRMDAPDHVQFIGPLPCAPGRADPAAPPWAGDDPRPLIVVTQGTLANKDLTQLLEPTLLALADQPVRVLATTGGRESDGLPTPENAWVVPFARFDHWLPRAAALVTNGGYGSVQFALSQGVPVIVAGGGEDKQEVGTRVAMAGCGVDLGTGWPTAVAVGRAVAAALHDPAVRAGARRIALQNHPADALARIAATVARLAPVTTQQRRAVGHG